MDYYQSLWAALRRELRDTIGYNGYSISKIVPELANGEFAPMQTLMVVVEGQDVGVKVVVDDFSRRAKVIRCWLSQTLDDVEWDDGLTLVAASFGAAVTEWLVVSDIDVAAIYNDQRYLGARTFYAPEEIPTEPVFEMIISGRRLSVRAITENEAFFVDGASQYRVIPTGQVLERVSYADRDPVYYHSYMWSPDEEELIAARLVEFGGGRVEDLPRAPQVRDRAAKRIWFTPPGGLKKPDQAAPKASPRAFSVGQLHIRIKRHYRHKVYFLCEGLEYVVNKWGSVSRVARVNGQARCTCPSPTVMPLPDQDKIVAAILAWSGGQKQTHKGENLHSFKSAA